MSEECWFITGYPALRARAVAEIALASSVAPRLLLLAAEARREEAEARLQALTGELASRCELVIGNASAIDFGLAGPRYLELAARITRIHHLYQTTRSEVDEREARKVNVASTREVIELAKVTPRLERLVHYSSVLISGDRTGVVFEDELNVGQSFRSPAEETLALAEALLQRTASELPLTIVRTGQIAGNSRTGEVERLDGFYPLLAFLLAGSDDEVALPLPSRSDASLHVVPVDFVARAGVELGLREQARGKTVQLIDPRALSARHFVEAAAELCGKRLVAGLAPAPLSKTLRNMAGLRPHLSQLRGLHELMTTPVSYDDRGAQSALAGSGIECPPLLAYLPVLVDYVRKLRERGSLSEQRPEEGPFLVE